MTQGAFVVDRVDSPLWTAAKTHASKVNGSVIAALSFRSPRKLAEHLERLRPAFIIFSWRGALDALLSDSASIDKLLLWNPTIHLLVPDHLGLERFSEEEKRRALSVDSVLVTSKILQDAYAERLGIRTRLLHDLPDTEMIKDLGDKDYVRDRHTVIWVGNSKWGERLGFKDHKGLKSIAIPVMNKLQEMKPDLKLVVIDSAKKKRGKREVLEAIRNSCCILITSDSEGTSLPLLEAMALGTPPVSFNVGVASELLTESLSAQVVSRDIEMIVNQVLDTIKEEERIGIDCRRSWLKYLNDCESEIVKISSISLTTGNWRTQPQGKKGLLVWFFQWIKGFLTL